VLALGSASCGGDAPEPSPDAVTDADRPTFPLDADIWLAELDRHDGALVMGSPREAIHRAGYDNQPYFTPDGQGFWYAGMDEHSGQAEIFLYRLDGAFAQVTQSAPESEYSPTPLPDGSGLSVVRVEADSTQRLWKLPFDGSEATVLVPALAPVGYHAWVDGSTVAAFVLGSPPTLQVTDLSTGTLSVVTENIGRSIRSIPGTSAVTFVALDEDSNAVLTRYDLDGTVTPLVETVGNGDFHAWTPDGTVLMADGPQIHAWTPGNMGWTLVADLSEYNVRVTRLAVSPDGTHIALVVEPGDVSL
jgi:Tol biopolymer transport system component